MTACQSVRTRYEVAVELGPGGRHVTPRRLLGPKRSRVGNDVSTGPVAILQFAPAITSRVASTAPAGTDSSEITNASQIGTP